MAPADYGKKVEKPDWQAEKIHPPSMRSRQA
jgi:hypothetical protein